MLSNLIKKYKSIILYGVFGVFTTLINIITYAVCYKYIGIPNVPSNIIAWILSVTFAFITNKLYVFDSKSLDAGLVIGEFIKFISARLATGGLDLIIMYVSVDLMHEPAVIFKVIANVIVIVLNYVLSKLVVFKKKNGTES